MRRTGHSGRTKGENPLKTEQDTPTMGRRVLRAARQARLGRSRDLDSVFEHGQWWIVDRVTGGQWSVNDAEGPGTYGGFDFEEVTAPDYENPRRGRKNPLTLSDIAAVVGKHPITAKIQKVAGQIQLRIEKPSRELLRRLGIGRSSNPSKARVFVKLKGGKEQVHQFDTQAEAYRFWTSLPKGVRAAFRGAGDNRPVYIQDYVDRY